MKIKLLNKKKTTPQYIYTGIAAKCCKKGSPIQQFKNKEPNFFYSGLTNKIYNVLQHKSILEHSGFNFGIENISRFAVEYLEYHRLGKYSEKSFRKSHKNITFYRETEAMKLIREAYFIMLGEGLKPEDARNILPLATHTDLVFTIDGHNLVEIVSKFISSPIKEIKRIGESFKAVIEQELFIDGFKFEAVENWNPYSEISIPPSGKEREQKSFKINKTNLGNYNFKSSRNLELDQYLIEALMTSSALAQLRRHRNSSLFSSAPSIYNDSFVPLVENKKAFKKIVTAISTLRAEAVQKGGDSLMYYSCMGGLRGLVWRIDGRSLSNFISLRTTKHAQTEIKNFALKIKSYREKNESA